MLAKITDFLRQPGDLLSDFYTDTVMIRPAVTGNMMFSRLAAGGRHAG